jgi:hypothetical protein
VADQATDAVERAERLANLRETYRRALASSRSRAPEVVDMIMINPFLTSRQVQDELGISQPGALNLVRRLESKGWLREIGAFGKGGRTYWVAPEVHAVITGNSSAPDHEGNRASTAE